MNIQKHFYSQQLINCNLISGSRSVRTILAEEHLMLNLILKIQILFSPAQQAAVYGEVIRQALVRSHGNLFKPDFRFLV